jgi:hypothetical protein
MEERCLRGEDEAFEDGAFLPSLTTGNESEEVSDGGSNTAVTDAPVTAWSAGRLGEVRLFIFIASPRAMGARSDVEVKKKFSVRGVLGKTQWSLISLHTIPGGSRRNSTCVSDGVSGLSIAATE